MSFGFLHLMPALSDFMARYPDVVVDLAMNDRFVDLVNEGFDIAIRIATLPDFEPDRPARSRRRGGSSARARNISPRTARPGRQTI